MIYPQLMGVIVLDRRGGTRCKLLAADEPRKECHSSLSIELVKLSACFRKLRRTQQAAEMKEMIPANTLVCPWLLGTKQTIPLIMLKMKRAANPHIAC